MLDICTVEIDEGGIPKLQDVLAENAALAEELAAAFDAASASIQNLVATLSAELPGLFGGEGGGNVTESLGGDKGLPLDLDLTTAGPGDSARAMGYEEPYRDPEP